MYFKDRTQAGQLLAERLKQYAGKEVVVYAIPRGGIIIGAEIVKSLSVPLDLVIVKKISHPRNPEYAIAAAAANGHTINACELALIDDNWLEEEIERQRQEAARRREKYLRGNSTMSPEGKIAIVVDDGAATGLTLRVAIKEIKHSNPLRLIVAVPIIPKSTAEIIRKDADKLVTLEMPSDGEFFGSVGSYYENFAQVNDKDVIKIFDAYRDQSHQPVRKVAI
ncbi:MAG: phosphoribosyl transferase [Candidatus Levybacteria bacterium]|nr:phosphoribosyl transferase [Candidatus Levybacteria bacterium]